MIHAYPGLFAILFFICVWVIVLTLISHIGGWASLAGRYLEHETFSGARWYLQSGEMRWLVGYHNCLTIGANPSGLYLSILLPFRIAHSPLFIPWRDISVGRKKILWLERVELQLGLESPIPLRINEPLAEKLKTAAGAAWPMQSVS